MPVRISVGVPAPATETCTPAAVVLAIVRLWNLNVFPAALSEEMVCVAVVLLSVTVPAVELLSKSPVPLSAQFPPTFRLATAAPAISPVSPALKRAPVETVKFPATFIVAVPPAVRSTEVPFPNVLLTVRWLKLKDFEAVLDCKSCWTVALLRRTVLVPGTNVPVPFSTQFPATLIVGDPVTPAVAPVTTVSVPVKVVAAENVAPDELVFVTSIAS